MLTIAFVITAYLIGSIPFAVVSSLAFGIADPRTYGSGNPGATNVLRSGNKAAALFTLLGDAAKGWVAVFLMMHYYPEATTAIALVAVSVFLGHVFPLFLNFKGGKGVATALGVLLALNVWLGLGVLLVWLVVAYVSRYSSLAALVAANSAPLIALAVAIRPQLVLATAMMSMLLIWRHKGNIMNLMSGKESKIGGKQEKIK